MILNEEFPLRKLNTSSSSAQLIPVDFHRHGVGDMDLSNLAMLVLGEVDAILREERTKAVLTLMLARANLGALLNSVRELEFEKRRGACGYIAGLALEGPLLSSSGGIPETCVWSPTKTEWVQLARCGEAGLKYIVISPDALGSIPISWIIQLLIDAGISPALGHFMREDPEASCQSIESVFRLTQRQRSSGRTCPTLLSDHLFNDMPLRIKHAWRTPEEKARRDGDLLCLCPFRWTLDNIDEYLGPVPGVLIRGAAEGIIDLCLNFDGEHVDLELAQHAVRLVGADHIIALTDRVDGRVLAGEELVARPYSRLLYCKSGIVAAGTTSLNAQVANMRLLGISEEDIRKMTLVNPWRVLGITDDKDDNSHIERASVYAKELFSCDVESRS